MKVSRAILVLAGVMCAGIALVACGPPQTKNTASVGGKYYQHVGDTADGAKIGEYLKLNDNGTWETGQGEERVAHTFTLDGTAIEIFFGTSRMMYGTIQNGKLELTVYMSFGWHDRVFFLES